MQYVRTFHDYSLAELRHYIDWQPFFNAWEMKGSYPDILNNPASGEAARKLYDDAQVMLDQIIAEDWLSAAGVFGLFPANAVGDDIEVYTDETPARGAHDAAPACVSRPSTAPASRTARWPTSSPRRRPACGTTSARSRSPPASAARPR